jgi:hypothetical protein
VPALLYMPSLSPRSWTFSAVPTIPSGKVVALGIIWLVLGSRPDLTDQQSSTSNCKPLAELGNLMRTVHVFISYILESQIDYLVCGCENLVFRDITMVRVPGVPSQCGQPSLHLHVSKIEVSRLSEARTYNIIRKDQRIYYWSGKNDRRGES